MEPNLVIALVGPHAHSSPLRGDLRDSGATVVSIETLEPSQSVAVSIITALACDIAVVELSAEVGLDATTPTIWMWLEAAGMPRIVAVTGLGATKPDFDDLTAIAQRVLGEECLPIHLPVLADDEHPVGSLDLTRLMLTTATEQRPAEAGHLSVSQGDYSALLSILAATVGDDASAAQYARELNSLGDVVGPLTTPPGDTCRVGDLATVVTEGLVAPVVAHTPDGAWIRDLVAWRSSASPAQRLVRRDEHDEPTQGWAGVALDAADGVVLIRPVFDAPRNGEAMITSAGADAKGRPVPLRAWPTSLTLVTEPAAAVAVPSRVNTPSWWRSAVAVHVGDTLAEGHVWLMPAHDPFD